MEDAHVARWRNPQEVAGAIVFLAFSVASYIPK
jgi:hypothetical protein